MRNAQPLDLQFFSVYDQKQKTYALPFLLVNRDMAIRAFSQICREPAHTIHENSNDFSLWHLGTFDQETGELVLMQKELIAEARDYREQPTQPNLQEVKA